jgi:hypothetical protein
MKYGGCDERPPEDLRSAAMRATTSRQASFDRVGRIRTIAYWTFTLPVAFENAAGAMWVLLPLIPRINQSHTAVVFSEYLHTMLAHLGYPQYFQYILGPWQLACAGVLLAPRLGRLKEWAYFGAFLNYSSAFVSHLFVGDRPDVAAAVIAGLTVSSWALRPPARRLAEPVRVDETGTLSWLGAAGTLALLLVLSLFWLPQLSTR